MQHLGTKKLTGQKVLLRALKLNDAQNYFDIVSDKQVCKAFSFGIHENIEQTKSYLQKTIKLYKQFDTYRWAIAKSDNDELVGFVSIFKIDEQIESAEIAYAVSKKHQGKGYAYEALKLLLKFLFNEVGFNRVQACVNLKNQASTNLLLKLNFVQEGIINEGLEDRYNGDVAYSDCYLLAVTKRMYNKN